MKLIFMVLPTGWYFGNGSPEGTEYKYEYIYIYIQIVDRLNSYICIMNIKRLRKIKKKIKRPVLSLAYMFVMFMMIVTMMCLIVCNKKQPETNYVDLTNPYSANELLSKSRYGTFLCFTILYFLHDHIYNPVQLLCSPY